MYVYYFNPDNAAPKVEKYIDNKKVIFRQFVPVNISLGMGIRMLRTGLFRSVRDENLPNHYMVYADKMQEETKYLIIRDEGIGDVLMTTPAVRALKELRPRCVIDYVTNDNYKVLLRNNPHINKVFGLGVDRYNDKEYDEIIDLRYWSEHSPNRNKVHRIYTYTEKMNVVINPGKEETILHISQELIDDAKKKIEWNPKNKYVVMQLGSTHYCRTWDYKKWIELTNKLIADNLKVILVDKQKYVINDPEIINLTGKTNVEELVGLIAISDMTVSSDTGAYHIAGALKKPFVALFGIITPKFRTEFYKSWHRDITPNGMTCLGCGDFHMSRCAVSGTELAVCMDKIEVLQVYNAVNAYFKGKNKRTEIITVSEKVPMEKPPMITKTNKATLAMIVLNEGKYLPRLMDNLFAHPSIKRIVAIDGGSEDNTVEILKKAGAEVFVHPWNFNYHDQVALQRNIMASYIPEEERFFYMDADEICSKDLLARLNEILGMPNRYICLSRRTFKNYNGAVKYFNILDRTKQHLNYPDYQPRIYTNDRYLKFFRSPHHLTLNIGDPLNVDADILHYERDEQEKNKARDKQWNNFMDMGRKLGLGSWYTDHTQNRRK